MVQKDYSQMLKCPICKKIGAILIVTVKKDLCIIKIKCMKHKAWVLKLPLAEKALYTSYIKDGVFRCPKCGEKTSIKKTREEGPWTIVRMICRTHKSNFPEQKIWSLIYNEISGVTDMFTGTLMTRISLPPKGELKEIQGQISLEQQESHVKEEESKMDEPRVEERGQIKQMDEDKVRKTKTNKVNGSRVRIFGLAIIILGIVDIIAFIIAGTMTGGNMLVSTMLNAATIAAYIWTYFAVGILILIGITKDKKIFPLIGLIIGLIMWPYSIISDISTLPRLDMLRNYILFFNIFFVIIFITYGFNIINMILIQQQLYSVFGPRAVELVENAIVVDIVVMICSLVFVILAFLWYHKKRKNNDKKEEINVLEKL